MNVYLAIITTALVITQIIRTTQNAIQLRRQRKEIDKTIGWIRENDVSEKDFEIQRNVFYLLKDFLKAREEDREDFLVQREVIYKLHDWLNAKKKDDSVLKRDDIVRCHECTHWQKWKSFQEDPDLKWCDKMPGYTYPAFNCGEGERKEK